MVGITIPCVQALGSRPAPQSEAALSTADNLEKLKRDLLCGLEPNSLDPLIGELALLVARLTGLARNKSDRELAGMSMVDISKAIMALQKALDATARLRSFAAGGPDARPEAPEFILKIVQPEEEPTGDRVPSA